MFNPNHSYTNNETNLQILHTLSKGPKLKTILQYEIYKHYKQSPINIPKISATLPNSYSLIQSHTSTATVIPTPKNTKTNTITPSSIWTSKH